MRIETIYGNGAAAKAKGLAVVVDVFRAFSTACYIYSRDAQDILSVDSVDLAYALKKENPDFILVGERDGSPPPGFDFGNSPLQIKNADLHKKTIVLTTSLGTQGIVAAQSADVILTGSFVNAGAIISYIKHLKPKILSLICTGTTGGSELDEDAQCARYIEDSLSGHPGRFEAIFENLKKSRFSGHFFDKNIMSHPEEDFYLCMALDRFDFVLKSAVDGKGLIHLKKIKAP